jgi:hypothetical protein
MRAQAPQVPNRTTKLRRRRNARFIHGTRDGVVPLELTLTGRRQPTNPELSGGSCQRFQAISLDSGEDRQLVSKTEAHP